MTRMKSKWGFEAKAQFKKQYKNLDPQIKIRVNSAVQELRNSENPAQLGRYKQCKRVFSYDLGRKYRIIYNINWSNNTIEFLRVCDHKSAYGGD